MFVFLITIAPWIMRNQMVMGYTGLRDNFGEELYLGNHQGAPEASGLIMGWMHPVWNPQELEKYRQQGELAYMQEKKQLAGQFIRSHPYKFGLLTLKRILYFWSGAPDETRVHPTNLRTRTAFLFTTALLSFWGAMRMMKRRVFGAHLFLSVLLLYPLVFYVIHVNPRYRHPIEPIMTILIAYLFCSAAQEKPAILRFSGKESFRGSPQELQAEALRK